MGDQPSVLSTVAAVRPDTSGHNLIVKVIEVKGPIERAGRPGSKPQKITECLVGDESGVILFTARNEQVDLMKPGSYLKLTNAKIDMVRSTMRLAVNNFGKIVELADGTSFEPKTDYNLSLIEYELVPVPAPSKAAAAAKTDAETPVEAVPEEA